MTSSRADAFRYENSFIYQRRGNRGYSDPRFRWNEVDFRNEKQNGHGFAAVSGVDRVCGTGAEFPCWGERTVRLSALTAPGRQWDTRTCRSNGAEANSPKLSAQAMTLRAQCARDRIIARLRISFYHPKQWLPLQIPILTTIASDSSRELRLATIRPLS